MAQTIYVENNTQQTVNFSTIEEGDFFIYSNEVCVKLDNNNPNYVVIDTGSIGKLGDTDQVILPTSVNIVLGN